LLKIGRNCRKLFEISQNCSTLLKIGRKCWQLVKFANNWPLLLNLVEISENWSKLLKIGQYWWKTCDPNSRKRPKMPSHYFPPHKNKNWRVTHGTQINGYAIDRRWREMVDRVTRFCEFSPIGWVFTLGIFLKINEEVQMFVQLASSVKVPNALIATKNGLGRTLVDFFDKLLRSHWLLARVWRPNCRAVSRTGRKARRKCAHVNKHGQRFLKVELLKFRAELGRSFF
jgi:hypothetical protein